MELSRGDTTLGKTGELERMRPYFEMRAMKNRKMTLCCTWLFTVRSARTLQMDAANGTLTLTVRNAPVQHGLYHLFSRPG